LANLSHSEAPSPLAATHLEKIIRINVLSSKKEPVSSRKNNDKKKKRDKNKKEAWAWFHSPMIFNVSGKAVPCLICGWEAVISWCCLKLQINKAIPTRK
jgi:hypothetical protein